tara:strand:- start:323 stop:778 length:456 start_codon:yes stop_codon:yes gene_type:complete
MEIILLEKVSNLGNPGELVDVKSGYARNYLIPFGKAVRANTENKAEYEEKRASLEKAEEERKNSALDLASKLESREFSIYVPVSEEDSLYGSVGTREITETLVLEGIDIEKSAIRLPEGTLKELGTFTIDIELHPEVIQQISVTIKAENQE